jgi:hypothetical protein
VLDSPFEKVHGPSEYGWSKPENSSVYLTSICTILDR